MRLNVKAMIFSLGILWGVVVFTAGLANIIWPGYGSEFLRMLASLYPGYKASGSAGDLITGILYALVDGGLFGLVLAWFYNRFLGFPPEVPADVKRKAGVTYPPIEPEA